MADISIFKKISLFREYRKLIRSYSLRLGTMGLRIDKANRLYTVLNIPEELIGEAYVLKKSDIDRISENYIKEYISEVSRIFMQIELNELVSVYEVKKVDKYSYLIVFGFSLFKSNEYYDRIYFRIIPAIVALSIVSAFIVAFSI